MGLTLAEQLKLLDDTPKPIDVDEAEDLDAHELRADREHYVDVGPSRLRNEMGVDMGGRYGGKASSRVKIFDDESEEEEQDEGDGDEDEEEDELDEDDEEEDEEEDDEEEDEEDDEEEDDDEEEEADEPHPRPTPSGKALDPVSALRESRQKDIEKGRGIKRQRDLFDTLLTLRITFQKALNAGFQVPPTSDLADDPAGEVESRRTDTLRALGDLNSKLFTLREGITLPGTESRKRRKLGDPTDEEYWTKSAADSFALADASHPHLVPILNKWSTKIQAASLQLSKGSKFSQKASVGVVDAIDAALGQKRDNAKALLEDEESAYRALLREVIESRQAGGVDLLHLRKEKKKKREAERGGSKGRKLRYTVHEKAANFVVPIPLENEWHEEQVDELFASLLGGAGIKGAVSTEVEEKRELDGGLGGLRVF